MKTKKQKNKIVILVLIVATMLMIGCNNGSKNAQIVTPVTEAPTAEVTGEVTSEPTPSLETSQETTPSITEVVTPIAEQTDDRVTPSQIPYEGYVIGKDVNNNELKLTPEEADEFVKAGNILKLYNGSWFDIDDDGEPEYVSIQPYGHWTSEIHDKGEYIIDSNGTPERREVPIQTDQVFKIQFTGYDWIPLDVDYSRQEKGIPCKDDIFVCVTSLDGVTKQIITLGTRSYGDWYESDYYVFRSNKKSLIPCGWLRCNLTDFQLNAEKRFKGYEWIEDSSIGDTIPVKATYWYDGEGIRVSLSDIDIETINNPLVVKNDEIRIKSISDDDVYFSAYSGEELYLYKVEMNKEALEAYCYARNLTDYNMQFKYYGGFRGIHLHNQDVDTVFKLFLEKKSTGEKGWLYQKNGIPVSADEKESYPACFGYYGAN